MCRKKNIRFIRIVYHQKIDNNENSLNRTLDYIVIDEKLHSYL